MVTKKRLFLVFIVFIISSIVSSAELPNAEKETTVKIEPASSSQQVAQSPINNPSFGEGLEYKDFKEATLPNGAKIIPKD